MSQTLKQSKASADTRYTVAPLLPPTIGVKLEAYKEYVDSYWHYLESVRAIKKQRNRASDEKEKSRPKPLTKKQWSEKHLSDLRKKCTTTEVFTFVVQPEVPAGGMVAQEVTREVQKTLCSAPEPVIGRHDRSNCSRPEHRRWLTTYSSVETSVEVSPATVAIPAVTEQRVREVAPSQSQIDAAVDQGWKAVVSKREKRRLARQKQAAEKAASATSAATRKASTDFAKSEKAAHQSASKNKPEKSPKAVIKTLRSLSRRKPGDNFVKRVQAQLPSAEKIAEAAADPAFKEFIRRYKQHLQDTVLPGATRQQHKGVARAFEAAVQKRLLSAVGAVYPSADLKEVARQMAGHI